MTDDDDRLEAALEAALSDRPPRTPPPDRVAALRARAEDRAAAEQTDADAASPPADQLARRRRPGRRDVLVGGVAASIGALAGVVGAVAARSDDGPDEPPTEPISFAAADGVQVRTEAELINHTWGVELVIDVDGLEPGTAYDVTYLGPDGSSDRAGSFLAVDVPMHCRFNAARLREATTAITITGPGAAEVLRADLA